MYLLTFLVELFVFSGLYLFFQSKTASVLITQKKNFYWLLGLTIILQIIGIALFKKEAGDVRLFGAAGWWLRQKGDFYYIDQTHGQYPFFPFLIFFHAVFNFFSEITPLFTFSFYLKLFCLLPSLYFLSWQIKDKIARLQLLTHPLTFMAVIFHGQIDVVLLAFLIASMLFLIKKSSTGKIGWAGILYALSILSKTWSVVFFPVICKILQRPFKIVKFSLMTLLTVFLDVFFYTRLVGSSFRQVFQAVISAGGTSGIWGISFIFPFVKINPLLFFTVLFIFLQIIILRKEQSIWQTCLLTVLGILLIIPKWGIQYLFWLLPFLFLAPEALKSKEALVFTVLGSLYAFLNYFNIAKEATTVNQNVINLTGFCLWGLLVYWFIILLNKRPIDEVEFVC